MSSQLQTALRRAALGGLLAGIGAASAALEAGASPRSALFAGAAALIIYLSGRGVLEGVIDTGRATN